MNNLLGELAAWYVLGNNHSKPTAEEVLWGGQGNVQSLLEPQKA